MHGIGFLGTGNVAGWTEIVPGLTRANLEALAADWKKWGKIAVILSEGSHEPGNWTGDARRSDHSVQGIVRMP